MISSHFKIDQLRMHLKESWKSCRSVTSMKI
jgi:hypothetical protein